MAAKKKHKLVEKQVSDLIPYVNNARTHSEEQVIQLCSSIKEFGFTNPVLIDEENGIIAGHGRLMAAKKMELNTVPCLILTGLSEAQKKAYVIADNKLAEASGWDEELLAAELNALSALDFDLNITGFSEADLQSFNALLGSDDQNFGDRNQEVSADSLANEMKLTFVLTRHDYQQVRDKLSEYDEVLEAALIKGLGL